MSGPQRYYSQQYSLVDNPTNPTGDRAASHTVYDERPTTPYRGYDFDEPLKSTPRATKGAPTAGFLGWRGWSKRRTIIIGSSVAATLVIIIIIIVAAVVASQNSFSYTPSFAQVTNRKAFASGKGVGGASHKNPNITDDGIGAGSDVYKYYQGDAIHFPDSADWVSFGDMWKANLHTLQTSCSVLGYGENNSPEVIQDIYDAIQNLANASLVDHRFIFAVILQESKGCVHTDATSNGVTNPGIMQSHNGHSYDPSNSRLSILAMVQDGTQGTESGAGLVQGLNDYGDAYQAARYYNSGYIPKSGDLSEAAGATACYVTDIANRMTGWVNAKSTCPGDNE